MHPFFGSVGEETLEMWNPTCRMLSQKKMQMGSKIKNLINYMYDSTVQCMNLEFRTLPASAHNIYFVHYKYFK
jgi:hypothetical protein